MDIASLNSVVSASPITTSYKPVTSVKPVKAIDENTNSDIAVVYEKGVSSNEENSVSSEQKVKSKVDPATIEKLKADAEECTAQLKSLVQEMFAKQGIAFTSTEEMFALLRKGDYTVDPEVAAKAKDDIAEDGYWGIEKTSDRLVDLPKPYPEAILVKQTN